MLAPLQEKRPDLKVSDRGVQIVAASTSFANSSREPAAYVRYLLLPAAPCRDRCHRRRKGCNSRALNRSARGFGPYVPRRQRRCEECSFACSVKGDPGLDGRSTHCRAVKEQRAIRPSQATILSFRLARHRDSFLTDDRHIETQVLIRLGYLDEEGILASKAPRRMHSLVPRKPPRREPCRILRSPIVRCRAG